ncbi:MULTISPECIES: SDR family oxidoreductase [unclassified Flavobacterium]|uniref:SDR family oxidoreductase n=1 Tax=unclassified Flavobacterium TaxID=196869 RepID=UPI003F925E30
MGSNLSLAGKSIVITGGTGVIGASFIKSVCNAGAAVGILGRNEQVATERANEIIKQGGKAIPLIADVTNEEQLVAARVKMLQAYGKIDGLVNAAGGNIPEAVIQPDQDIFKLNMSAIQDAMNLNLFGSILPTQVFGEAIKNNGSGSIVNSSSVTAHLAVTKVLGYSLGKAAIDCYTQWFAVELAKRFGDKIRMNSIVLGFVLTEQNKTLLTNEDGSLTERGNLIINKTPFNRFGTAQELEGALVWLLSDDSKFVTGSKITVDGGFSVYSGV